MHETRFPDSAKWILRYFVRNPEAADTCEGIARWRLLEETIYQTTAQTVEGVAWLESHGYLMRIPTTTGSAPLFVLNRSRSKDVADFLAETEPSGDPMPIGKTDR